jgi:hypothetical protein
LYWSAEKGRKLAAYLIPGKVLADAHGKGVSDSFDMYGPSFCRSTQIHFYCCTSDKLAPDVKKSIKDLQTLPFAVAQLASVAEVSLCNYTMTVCTPLLCGSGDSIGGPLAGEARTVQFRLSQMRLI